MKRIIAFTIAILLLLSGCQKSSPPQGTTAATAVPVQTQPVVTEPITTETEPVLSQPTEPEPTEISYFDQMKLPGIYTEDIITYFNEVCLDAEWNDGGDPSKLQKWMIPIQYAISGNPTEEDFALLEDFCAQLSEIDGFPGISAADESTTPNLTIHFCLPDEMAQIMNADTYGLDGYVTFWYDTSSIYKAVICVRSDLDQTVRNSVIQEELYNGLGPVQDTDLRTDSLIYSGFSTPQTMTEMDELILRLLYHPDMKFGMDREACETVIRQLISLPEAPSANDPSYAEYLLNEMTLEEKVGQLFVARCPDTNQLADIEKYHLGGYFLFGRDFDNKSPEQVKEMLDAYQAAAEIPMLIAVDEEGGTVCRVSSHTQFRSSPFPSPRWLYGQGGLELIFLQEQEKCQLLNSLGINVNAAPVCDITTEANSFMYSRSLGQTPEITGEFVSGVVGIMNDNQIGGMLKHFPGYGNNVDTHIGIAVDNRTLAELESCDLIPFAAGIDAGCGAIMVSHTFVNCLDTQYPASLSPAVHRYLRENMGFSGVIATDDLVMQAITDLYGHGEAAVLAVLAGNDLLCCTEYQVQYDAVLQAVKDGRISEEQLNESVVRILKWKQNIGIL